MVDRRSRYLATSKAFLIMFALTLLVYLLGYLLADRVSPRPLDALELCVLPAELLGALMFFVIYLVTKREVDECRHSPVSRIAVPLAHAERDG